MLKGLNEKTIEINRTFKMAKRQDNSKGGGG
jgi:hypothetical protein